MYLFSKKYLLFLCLFASFVAGAAAQEQKVSFTWLDRSENNLTGQIAVNLISRYGDGQYELNFSVIWNDAGGNPITEISRMPFLCLSKYDFELSPALQIRCTSFDKRQSSLIFQSADKLYLQVESGYTGDITFSARFQYALTRELYESGKSERVELTGAGNLKMIFHQKLQNAADEHVIAENPQGQRITVLQNAALKAVATDYHQIWLKVNELYKVKSADSGNRQDYLRKIEDLSNTIEREKADLNPDSLPTDSFQLYRERYNHLNDALLELRSAFWRNQTSDSSVLNTSEISERLKSNDSLRNLIRIRLAPAIRSQLDSLIQLSADYKAVADEIKALASVSGNTEHTRLDSLIMRYRLIRKDFLNLNVAHENTWSNYRVEISGLMPVSEIEEDHAEFITKQSDLLSSIDETDKTMLTIGNEVDTTPWYMSNRLIWIGLLTILLLVVVSTIWSYITNKRRMKSQLVSLENGQPIASQGLAQKVKSDFSDVSSDYYTINYLEEIPESVVGIVHYHSSAIKAIYHSIHSALQERNGTDFGGYLFGNQYKLHGKNYLKSEIFIEKACESKYLRPSISSNVGDNADLVDELDEWVRQNKKYRLIGWYTSCADNSMEVPEGLMKVHRTFFKEKWHVGLLVNSASEVLQGAAYLRRKSGYLDPMPDPAAFIELENLYRYALDPSTSNSVAEGVNDNKEKDYSRIELNNTWGDSIVNAVSFDLPVVNEIMTAAANQAIPQDSFQTVGYLYGKVITKPSVQSKPAEFDVFIDRFIELRNETAPRDIPGLTLIGWWGQANIDVMNYLNSAVDYHEKIFKEAFQIACLVNPGTGELRIFTRKHTLEMNNSTIETEEYSIAALLSR